MPVKPGAGRALPSGANAAFATGASRAWPVAKACTGRSSDTSACASRAANANMPRKRGRARDARKHIAENSSRILDLTAPEAPSRSAIARWSAFPTVAIGLVYRRLRELYSEPALVSEADPVRACGRDIARSCNVV